MEGGGKVKSVDGGELHDGLIVGAWGERGGDVASGRVNRRGGGKGRRAAGERSLA